MAEVKLVNVCKSYDDKNNVVKDVHLNINDKEFVVLVGPSGCGKSTTLRMIAGLEDITSGEIYLDGMKVNDVAPKDRDIAMVFQNYALYPHMTVFENMAFGLKIRKMKKDEIKSRVDEAANILGIEELLQRKPKQLSGGQRQRVAVGRAIVRKPKVFLFDEPLSNLDAKLRVQMRTEISKLHKKLDATMIYVTHDQTEAMTMGDRIVIMKDGIVNQVDSPLNLYNTPVNKFVAGFIGSPSMNFIEGKIINDAGLKFNSEKRILKISPSDKEQKILTNYLNKNVVLGIRSENILPNDLDKKANVKVVVEVVEPMGNEVFAYFTIEDSPFVGRFNTLFNSKPGSTIEISFDRSKLLFFDRESGDRI